MAGMDKGLLEDAFLEFSRASESVIAYYSVLEKKIEELKKEIAKKNRELERTKEYLHRILDSLPLAVLVMEKKRVLFSNKKANELKVQEMTERLNFNGKKGGEFKISGFSYRWKRETLKEKDRISEILVIEDITEVEKMKERLETDERMKAMGEMALRIAHEIKNPLSSMELFASMLLKESMEGKQRCYLEHICTGIKSIDRIVNNILSYTKPKTLSLKEGRLSDAVKEVLDFVSLTMEQSGIKVSFIENEKGTLRFDPHLIKLALMNLLINAKEALRDGGNIVVEVKEAEKSRVLQVSDDGPGMPEDVKRNIFNPFFTTKDRGLGLGLFIVYNIVKAHNGLIEVDSRINEGTRFSIYLPGEKDGRENPCG